MTSFRIRIIELSPELMDITGGAGNFLKNTEEVEKSLNFVWLSLPVEVKKVASLIHEKSISK